MRIAVLASSYPRFKGDGVAPFVKSISEALHKRGHHVEVVAPYDIDVVEDTESKVVIHRFKYAWPKNLHVMGHARSLKADVKLRPLAIFLLPIFTLASIFKLITVAKKMDAEVVHAHWVLPNGLSAAIASKFLKIPFIISLHGSDIFMADQNFLFRATAKWVFSKSAYVTACSQELFDRAKQINSQTKIKLLAWGADPELFKPIESRKTIREKYGWAQDEVVIVTLGRFVHKKGFDRLISLIPSLPFESAKIRVVIGGSGPLKEDYNQQVKQLNLQDIVSFPGQIDWYDVPEFLAAADIFVLPSQRDQAGNLDGLPTVLLEAMACGLPCIASDIGGVSLVIEHLENGIIIKLDDQQSLRKNLCLLIKNKNIRDQLGEASRESVLNHYNWGFVANVFEQLFHEATKAKTQNLRLGQQYRISYLQMLNKIYDGEKVLDIGCHNNELLTNINAKLRVGIDLDPDASTNYISMVKADTCNLPFKSSSFDIVYMLDIIEHIEDDQRAINEVIKIIKPSGKLILTTPGKNIKIFPGFLTGWVSIKWGHTLRRGYEQEELISLINHADEFQITNLKAQWYRFLYFPLRLLFPLAPNLTKKILQLIVKQEGKKPYGSNGFLLLEVTKQ